MEAKIQELQNEVLQLQKDLIASPDEDKPIIQEEINRINAEIVRLTGQAPAVNQPIGQAVAPVDQTADVAPLPPEEQELLNEARQATGEGQRQKYPSAPKVKLDNVKIKKIVDGEELEGKPLQRFIHVHKEGEEWVTDDLGYPLTGVILKVRRYIKEKFDEKNPTKQRFESFEYTQGDPIRVYVGTKKEPTIIFHGTEDECVNEFATGEVNKIGKPKVSYEKYALIYMLVSFPGAEEPKLIKFETKISVQDHALWPYLFSFGENDTFLGYKTVITCEWVEYSSTVKAWKPLFTKGEKVDLKQSLSYLKELNKLFDIMDGKVRVAQGEQIPMPEDEPPMLDAPSIDDYSQPEPEEIRVEDIPF